MTNRTKATLAATAMAIVCGLAGPVVADVPDGIDYQGYLTNSDGSAVTGDVSMVFVAYNVDIGGVPLWSHPTTVPLDNGLFSVTLGSPVNPFPPALFDGPVYIGLVIDNEELLPRRAIKSTGYSFKASDAETLSGMSAASLDQSSHVVDTNNPHGVTAAQAGAPTLADLANMQAQLDAATELITTLQNALATTQSDLADETANRIAADNNEQAARLAADAAQTAAISAIESNSVLSLDGILSLTSTTTRGPADTLLIEGVNLQVVNGTGSTDMINGLGNLIVGYNVFGGYFREICSLGEFDTQVPCEANGGVWAYSHKSGSHNVVIGEGHSYSRHSGLVAGEANNITGVGAAVTGGSFNLAMGLRSSISGGEGNRAIGLHSSVAGGGSDSHGNIAQGVSSTVCGGDRNSAVGDFSTIAGGFDNFVIAATHATIVGGQDNTIVSGGDYGSISGGFDNRVLGDHASISGGANNEASGLYSSVSGGQYNIASGVASSVTGGGFAVEGFGNEAAGDFSTVSSGRENQANGDYSSVSGGRGNTSDANSASITGGQNNAASGDYSSISGGSANTATNSWSSASGGQGNNATGLYSSASGGQNNAASGNYSSITGGNSNSATNSWSSVSGGNSNDATGLYSSVSGGLRNIASGSRSSTSGGADRNSTGEADWRAGTLFENF